MDTIIDQCYATVMKTGTDAVGPGHNLIIENTTAKTAMTPTETILGPTIGTTNDNTGIIHDAHTRVLIHIILTMTLHTADHLQTGAHQLTQEITADHALDQPTIQLRKPCINLHHNPEDHKVRHIQKGIQESQ